MQTCKVNFRLDIDIQNAYQFSYFYSKSIIHITDQIKAYFWLLSLLLALLPNSLVSVLPLMLPLFGIRSLKTSVHHPLLPLLERSSKPISMQRLILLSSFSLMASPWCRPTSVPGLWICILLLSCCALESTTQWRLSAIKVKLELELPQFNCFRFASRSLQKYSLPCVLTDLTTYLITLEGGHPIFQPYKWTFPSWLLMSNLYA